MAYPPYPRKPRKPRPTWVIQKEIDTVERLMREKPKTYNANYYDLQRRCRRDLVELRDELRRAEAMYLKKPTQPEPTPEEPKP